MASNVRWGNQMEGNYSGGGGGGENNNAWNRPLVNTPQTNPASWPQLGATKAEAEQASTPQQQQAQEDTGWSSTAVSNPTTNSETTASAWGRMPDNSFKKASASGWGNPSSGPAWGQPTTVDNGTALWGKSSAEQSQGNWGGSSQPAQGNETSTSTTGWGVTNMPANSADSNTQQTPPSSSAATATSQQPVSWAKAASAGLPTSNNDNETTTTEVEQESTETPVAPSATSTAAESDPVQKLVNSHEGWGKKPIQQGTSWNISDSGPGYSRSINQVSNGTEAWGKHSEAQAPSGSGWGDNVNSKPSSGWGANAGTSYPPVAPNQGWGVPSQQSTRPPFISGNGPASTGWGDRQQPSGINNGRWNEMSNQGPNSGWGGGPPVPQQSVNPGWGGTQSNVANSSGWGAGPTGLPTQGSGWGANMVQQSPTMDQPSWGRGAEAARPVDNGTSAWGDPGTYTKVNMWDKRGAKPGANNEAVGGQMPPMNTQMKATGWGTPSQPPNRPPSPKGWGDISPTRNNQVDNGTSGWGPKPVSGEKWDKNVSGGVNNWNSVKPGGGWQPNEPQWGAGDSGGGWGQNDGVMKGNMDFSPRGLMPPQLNMAQHQMMLRNQTPPNMAQQNHFQQIRNAIMNGIVPPQVLHPQVVTPQHIQNVMQIIAKTGDSQKLQAKIATLANQNKSMPNMMRQQQIDQLVQAHRQQQHHLEMLKSMIMQNIFQKTQPNAANKLNNPMAGGGGMDLSRMRSRPNSQPIVSPLNNMNPMMQALPNSALPSVTSPTAREESRFMNTWKQPNNFGMGDSLLQPNLSNMGINMGPGGPGGDSAFNGSGFRPLPDEANLNDVRSTSEGGAPHAARDLIASQVAVDPNTALADIGPPEFTPGVPWKGFRHIDPEADPNITPGSVAIAKTMSINTVRDADQVLNRDRSTGADSSAIPTSSSIASTAVSGSAEGGAASQIWSSSASEGGNWSGQNPDPRGLWLVLTNFNQQVDPVYVQGLCGQHGTVISFQPHCPMEGTALVKYHSPEEAANAKKALNMHMVGSTMLVATVATDQEVNNFMTATAGGSWSSATSTRFTSGANSNAFPSQAPIRDASAMPSSVPPQQYWGSNAPNVTPGTTWAGNASYNLAWSRSTGEEPGRVMSPMHSLLPENLLGGETM